MAMMMMLVTKKCDKCFEREKCDIWFKMEKIHRPIEAIYAKGQEKRS